MLQITIYIAAKAGVEITFELIKQAIPEIQKSIIE